MYEFEEGEPENLELLNKEIISLIQQYVAEQVDFKKNFIANKIENKLRKAFEIFQNGSEVEAFLETLLKEPEGERIIRSFFNEHTIGRAMNVKNTLFLDYFFKASFCSEVLRNINKDSAFLGYLINDDLKDYLIKYLKILKNPNQLAGSGAGMGSTLPLLQYLVKKQKFDWIPTLIEHFGKEFDFACKDRYQRTLLHQAVLNKDKMAVEFWLNKGLRPDMEDLFGFTPLTLALFDGDLELATLLSKEPKETLEKDPRFKNPPPTFAHAALVRKAKQYLEFRQERKTEQGIKGIQTGELSSNGVCHGWSFLAALGASSSKQEVYEHYKMSEMLSNLKSEDELSFPVTEMQGFQNRDQLFNYFTEELFWFLGMIDPLLSEMIHPMIMTDRVRQLEMVSKKRSIQNMAEFGLPDLTQDEYLMILELFHPEANHMIIDVSSGKPTYARNTPHNVCFYQGKSNELQYFDSNIPYCLPSYTNYNQVLKYVLPLMLGQVTSLFYYHADPAAVTPQLMQKMNEKVDALIEKLIVNHPERMKNIQNIISHVFYFPMPRFLDKLLKHKLIADKVTAKMLSKYVNFYSSQDPPHPNFLVVYENASKFNYSLKDESLLTLFNFLKAAIAYDHEKLYYEVKSHLERRMSEFTSDPKDQKLKKLVLQYLALPFPFSRHDASFLPSKPLDKKDKKEEREHVAGENQKPKPPSTPPAV